MLDQSFSAKNFYTILLEENRKGINLEKEFFKTEIFDKYSLKIKEINKKLRTNIRSFIRKDNKSRNYTLTQELYIRYKARLNYIKSEIKKEKEEKLLEIFEKICNNVQNKSFKIKLNQSIHGGKAVYSIDRIPEYYFTAKKLQNNFHQLYGIKQSNRYQIISQIKCLINDKFPKYIIRTDIKGFYESILNVKITNKLNEENLLSPFSKKIIKQLIREYEKMSGLGKGVGIPRGVGISAYLAEYYMRKIDKNIESLPFLSYYARYVDDIIIVFTPQYTNGYKDYFDEIEKIITKDTGLSLNLKKSKTQKIDLIRREDKNYNLNYLGYQYCFANKPKRKDIEDVKIYLSSNKFNRYRTKIRLAFNEYNIQSSRNPKRAFNQLRARIKYLTGNTRLVNNKCNILVGIYFSNSFLTEEGVEELKKLDTTLLWYINRNIKNKTLKNILYRYNFYSGYTEKKYYKFSSKQLEMINNIWSSI